MKFRVKRGTPAQVIQQTPNQDATVLHKNWTVRKDIEFVECLIDPIVVKSMVEQAQQSLAGSLANQGYALFGGDSGGDRQAKYIIAIEYGNIEVVP
jgi:hypothetical protein